MYVCLLEKCTRLFLVLHYVFNWVEVSSNIVVNDEQFIHFLFVLIPVASKPVYPMPP